jgi:DNA polymerase-1
LDNKKAGLPAHLLNPDPSIYNSNNYLVLDFETDGFPADPKSKLVLSGWKRADSPFTHHFGGEYDLARLHSELDSVDFVVAQNAKFELQWLIRSGYDVAKLVVFDTYLAEYCILGNRYGPKDLDSLGEKYVGQRKKGLVAALFAGGSDSSSIPRGWLVEYNQRDVELTEAIFRRQRGTLKELGLLPVFYTRCLTTIPLADIELRGICLDPDRVKEKLEEVEKELNVARRTLEGIAGGTNWNSTKQVAALLYDTLGFSEPIDYRGEVSKTDAGGRRTDEATIAGLKISTDEQRHFKSAFLDYRKLNLAHSNLSKLQECCVNDNGILFASYNQAVTQTHRLSSSGAKYKFQFQNIDRSFKKLFRARRSGWMVGEADGRQLEFRVAIHLGRDKQGLEDVRSGFDVHKNTASVLNKVPLNKVTSEMRTLAKPETFKPLYGGRSGTKDQKRYYEAFRKRYNDTFMTQEDWTYDVLREGKLRIASGLIFYWPDTKQSKSGYITNTPSIFNYPVQSFATADIIPISLVYLWHLLIKSGGQSFIVNTVHDSVIAEICPGEETTFSDLCKRAFTSDVFMYLSKVYGVSFICPLGTEIKIGSHWGSGEVLEDKFDLDPEKYDL